MFEKTFYFKPIKGIPAYYNKRPGKDAGYDLYAAQDIWFWPFQTKTIKSNIHLHIPSGRFGFVTSRSGRSKKGWLVHNGIIDHGYSGNIKIIISNLSFLPRRVKKGTRITQILMVPYTPVDMVELPTLESFENKVEELSQSDRKSSGFGDSGIA